MENHVCYKNDIVNFKVGKYLCEFKNALYVEQLKKIISTLRDCIDLRIWFYGDTHAEFLNRTRAEVEHEIDFVVERIKTFSIEMENAIIEDWNNNWGKIEKEWEKSLEKSKNDMD